MKLREIMNKKIEFTYIASSRAAKHIFAISAFISHAGFVFFWYKKNMKIENRKNLSLNF